MVAVRTGKSSAQAFAPQIAQRADAREHATDRQQQEEHRRPHLGIRACMVDGDPAADLDVAMIVVVSLEISRFDDRPTLATWSARVSSTRKPPLRSSTNGSA